MADEIIDQAIAFIRTLPMPERLEWLIRVAPYVHPQLREADVSSAAKRDKSEA